MRNTVELPGLSGDGEMCLFTHFGSMIGAPPSGSRPSGIVVVPKRTRNDLELVGLLWWWLTGRSVDSFVSHLCRASIILYSRAFTQSEYISLAQPAHWVGSECNEYNAVTTTTDAACIYPRLPARVTMVMMD